MDSERNINLPRLERPKRKKSGTANVVFMLAVFFLCGSLGFWAARIIYDPLIPPDKADAVPSEYHTTDMLNILILGVDQRENESARADTIVMAFLDLEEKEINLLSIPRDTRVAIPGKDTTRKINYAHTVGGAKLTAETVEHFLGVPVHYYIETNFDGFGSIIDTLGGVTLNVEQRMYKPEENIDLQPGMQKLNGYDALAYVRWRDDGRGDIGRIERQQKFFHAITDQALRFSTIWKIPELLAEVNKQVKTDMKLAKMITLANSFRDIASVKLEAIMVPGVPEDINGGSYWIVNGKAVEAVLDKIYEKQAKK